MAKLSLNYYQSLHVGKVKTDVIQYTTIQAAITAAPAVVGKRFAVYVHPGTYSEKVTMKDYCDVVATGGREETVITNQETAGGSDNAPTVTGANAMFKGFTIESDGTNKIPRCLQNATVGFELEDCVLNVTVHKAGDIALNASASCDIRDCVVDSAGLATTGALFTTAGQTYNIENTSFDALTDAIQVTTTPTLNLINCRVLDNFNQDGGTVNVQRCQMEALDFGTAACTFAAELSRVTAGVATAGAFAHSITCAKCSFNGQNFNNAATGATTISLRDCDGIATLTNAGVGGTVTLYECGVETLTTSQGTVTAYGGRINACGGSTGTSFVWWLNSNELQVIANMTITHALAAAGAGDTIHVGPGTYAETAGASLTMVASVHLVGTDPDQCSIVRSDAVAPIVTSGVTCTISNITIGNGNAGAAGLRVTAGSLTLRNCYAYGTGAGDAIAMTSGTLYAFDSRVGAGDIDLSTGACNLYMYRCQITSDPIDTAGALAHNLRFEQCDFNTRDIVSAATLGTAMTMLGCTTVGTITHAGTGTFSIRDSDVSAINLTNAAGSVTAYGGNIMSITRAAGSFVWWKHNNEIYVLPSATTTDPMVASALTAAAAGDVITISPGTYAESNLTLKASVDLVGTDPDQCLIVVAAANPILNAGVTCTLSNLTIGNGNAGGTAITITANTLTVRNCYLYGTGAGDAIAMTAGTLIAYDTRVGAGDIDLSTAICTLTMYRCQITTDPTDTAGAFAHVLTFEECDFGTRNLASAATGATTLAMRGCTNVGTISNAGTGAFTIRDSDISTISVTNAAGSAAIYGGYVGTCGASTGVVTWRTEAHKWQVISGMKIMDAADAAAAGDTILIGPGTFTEALDLDAAINACTYKGFGRDKTIITQPTGTTVLVDDITAVVLEDLTINLTAGVNGNAALKLNAVTAAGGVTLRNVDINATWTAGTVYGMLAVDAAGNVATAIVFDSDIYCLGGANSYAVAANTCTTATSTISLFRTILNGQTYDIYNDRITIDTHKCELNGAGWWIQNNATAIGLAMDNENPNTVTPVTFAGAAGEFADLTGAELYTCLAGVLVGMPVYVSAANTVVAATNAAAAPIPAEGIVVYKPGGAGATTCYVKNGGMFYMATPPVVWAAGTNVWLGVAGVTLGQLVARPTNALKQVLGVGVDTKRVLINIAPVEVVTEWMNIPIAWGAGSAPTGTHTDGNSRRALAIVGIAGQTVFSQAVAIPEGYLAFSKLYVTVFPNGTGSFDWTAYSSAAKSTEDEATHSDTATADGQAVTDDIIRDHDISAAADGYTMEERDIFSAELIVDVLTTITQLEVLGFRLEYTTQRGA